MAHSKAFPSAAFACTRASPMSAVTTRVLVVDPSAPDRLLVEAVREAAECLRAGGLVAMPTETVYGLAAHALDPRAVARIFEAKGRPSTNPLIVHVADVAEARALSSSWPASADALAARFWPGPLTLVVPRTPAVPDVVTAGGSTVAVRVPAHPVALALLRAARIPLAAPSANPSMAVSPTTAQHVLDGLRGRVDLILDAGPTSGGIESTVLHLGTDPPRLLRPGLVSPAELESVIGPLERGSSGADQALSRASIAPSPGMMERHYAPRARLQVVADDAAAAATVAALLAAGARVGWLALDLSALVEHAALSVVPMPRHAAGYAARLYAALHELDAAGVDHIVVAEPPDDDAWLGVRDRLRRAAAR